MKEKRGDFLYLLGFEYLKHGKITEAITLLRALLIIEADDCKTLQAVAYCLLLRKDYGGAMEMAERAIAFSSRKELRFTLLLKARALLHLGKVAEGRAIMKSLKESSSRD
jgi:tetratricopeptide (TPR) repeat protein